MITAKDKVSVIIPTYNNAEFLPNAIDSVISQTYSNIEIIVVNDGSNDNTDEVVKGYLDNIAYIKQKNAGPSSARNAGIRKATGRYIAFLDADDIWMPEKIEEQVKVFLSNPNAGLVYSQLVEFNHFTGEESLPFKNSIYSGRIFDDLLSENFIAMATVIVKSSVLNTVGGFDESLYTAEDTNLWLRIAKEFDIIGMDSAYVKRRKHNANISDRVDIPVGTLDSLDKIVKLFPETDPMKYPPMQKAYLVKGKGLIIQYFYNDEYDKCHEVCKKLLTVIPTDKTIIFYMLLTMLPSSLLDAMRKMRKWIKGG